MLPRGAALCTGRAGTAQPVRDLVAEVAVGALDLLRAQDLLAWCQEPRAAVWAKAVAPTLT